jgi:hypothetical protein
MNRLARINIAPLGRYQLSHIRDNTDVSSCHCRLTSLEQRMVLPDTNRLAVDTDSATIDVRHFTGCHRNTIVANIPVLPGERDPAEICLRSDWPKNQA